MKNIKLSFFVFYSSSTNRRGFLLAISSVGEVWVEEEKELEQNIFRVFSVFRGKKDFNEKY
ncbi:MAG: hypothetical protein U9P79_02620 [Candidatus Cloacimonadota bacterium]|nr:hypothetical protein [Candidatus Cloacimonadota bacterium]